MLTCSHIFHAGCVQILCVCAYALVVCLICLHCKKLNSNSYTEKIVLLNWRYFLFTPILFYWYQFNNYCNFFLSTPCAETYSELCQISKMGLYAKIVNGWEYTSDKILRLTLPTYICLFKVRNIVKSLCYFVNINLSATCKLHSILSFWFLAEPK